jgi:hypothetical protein
MADGIRRTPREVALADMLLRKMQLRQHSVEPPKSSLDDAEWKRRCTWPARQTARAEAAYLEWRRKTLG